MRSNPANETEDLVFFGPFRLSATGRFLERNGRRVAIGARALDILIVLVEQAGKTVSHQELVASVWPKLAVAESSLRVHVNKLRRVLGDADSGARYVQNVVGRGYRFVEPVSRLPTAKSWAINEFRWIPQRNLPPASTRMVGRDAMAGEIGDWVRAHRFVTIVGPGGVGKTTLCVAVCYAIADAFDGRVVFVDLGAISDRHLVLTTIRSALGLPTSVDTLAGLLRALQGHRLLLVLDCCEHVAEEAATIAEHIFRSSEGSHLLLTSREPLQCEGEQVFIVPPLAFPTATESLTARDALAYPAVKLFIDSVSARDQGFQLQNAEAPIAASICQRVDGIALALELAAGRVSAFGLDEVHRQLEGRMKLLWQGKRTAPPRQQTLSATLDWSFKLLSDFERKLLCRLSIFVGPFTLEDAIAVAADGLLSELDVVQSLGGLVDRCLVALDLVEQRAHYRLLDMTREYAYGKISSEREKSDLARRHAQHFLQILSIDGGTRSGQMMMHHGVPPPSRLGNIHAALEWCFAADEYSAIRLGMHLVAASGNFLLSQGLTLECRKWTEEALERIPEVELDTRLELRLQIVLASTYTLADYAKRAPVIDRAIYLSRELGELRLYHALLYERRYDQAFWGEPQIALQIAMNSRAELSEFDNPRDLMIAEATIASISHTLGLDLAAHMHFSLAFLHLAGSSEQPSTFIEEKSLRRIRSTYANNLYTCGFVDQAAAIGQEFIEEFESSKDFLAFAEIMPRISFIFEWRREWHKVAQIYNAFVISSMGQPSEDMHYVYSIMRCRLLMNIGEFQECVARLREHFAAVPPLSPGRFILFVPLCEALVKTGQHSEALEIIDQALIYESSFYGTGFQSEYLLCKANILIDSLKSNETEIERLLQLSLDSARRQTSLTREIDAALALAKLLHRQNRVPESYAVLKPVYDRFTEGFETSVLVEARKLLNMLDDSQGIVRRN